MSIATQQTLKQFAGQYMLTIKAKPAKDQSGAYTKLHTVYKIKIKSPLLPGKLKCKFTTSRKGDLPIEDILSCLKLDAMTVHPEYAEYETGMDFAYTMGYDNIRQGVKVWESCQAELAKMQQYFGEAPLLQLFDCEAL